MRRRLCIALGALLVGAAVALERTPSPPGAEVYIISPADRAVLQSPVTVRFGLRGMGIAPAGIAFESSGHHHLLIDTEPPADLGRPLPTSEQVVHFGKGQTEAQIKLAPGTHTLQLVLGDHLHVPHDPPVISRKITIEVKE